MSIHTQGPGESSPLLSQGKNEGALKASEGANGRGGEPVSGEYLRSSILGRLSIASGVPNLSGVYMERSRASNMI